MATSTESSSTFKKECKDIRCPKCEKIFPILPICPHCGFTIISSFNELVADYKKMNTVSNIGCALFVIMIPVLGLVFLGCLIGNMSSGVLKATFFAFIISMGIFTFSQSYAKDISKKIRKYNPDQSISILGIIARIVAIGVGVEILHMGMDSFSHGTEILSEGTISLDQYQNIDIDVEQFGIADYHISSANQMCLDLPSDIHSTFTEPNNLHYNDFSPSISIADQADNSIRHSFGVHDRTGSIDSYIETNGNVTTFRDAIGQSTGHVIANNTSSDILKNNLDITQGYIEHIPDGSAFITNHLGVKEFKIESNGNILNGIGVHIGTIEKLGNTISLKDRLGICKQYVIGA